MIKARNAIDVSKCRTSNYDVMPKIRTLKILSIKFLKRHIFGAWTISAHFLRIQMCVFAVVAFFFLLLHKNSTYTVSILQSNRARLVSTAYVCCCKTVSIARYHRHIIIIFHLSRKNNNKKWEWEWNTAPLQYYSVHKLFARTHTLQSNSISDGWLNTVCLYSRTQTTAVVETTETELGNNGRSRK